MDGEAYEDVAWSYPDPLADNPQIQGLVCFLNEQAYTEVDGERLKQPTTQWSEALRSNVRGGQRQRARATRWRIVTRSARTRG